MSNLATRTRLLPETKSSRDSQWSIFEDQHIQKPNLLPRSFRLIVTTTRGVYAWDADGVIELFRSGSEGIVAAKKLTGHDEMLAVADSQVVILHDIEKGMQRSYRLKGTEGQVRLLKYAGNLSKKLYFTTSLRNSVQSFSLTHSKMLGPSDSHPSPPSVFALSCTSHLLLSTSTSPPTIYLRNLGQNVPSILLHPHCSSSAVTAAGFHPEAANIFVLAFADGSVAVYDASLISRDFDDGGRAEGYSNSRSGGEIGSIKGLHAISSKRGKHPAEVDDWITDPDGSSIQAGVSTITAVALVSGQRATAVTVGADGKCCVVDFTKSPRNKAVLKKSWHLRRPATSLSIACTKQTYRLSELDETTVRNGPANDDYCIAVGRQDGKVTLFDLGGKPLGKQILDPKGAPVVDVEWTKKDVDAGFPQIDPSVHRPSKTLRKRKSLGTDIMKKCLSEHELRAPQFENFGRPQDAPSQSRKGSRVSSRVSSKAVNHLDLALDRNAKLRDRVNIPKSIPSQPLETDGSVFTLISSCNSDSFIADFTDPPPPVPPRPIPRPGGKLSQRRSLTIREVQAQPTAIEPDIASNDRQKTAKDATLSKLPVTMTSPARSRLFAPRSPTSLRVESWKQGSSDCSKDVSSRATCISAQVPNFQARLQRDSPASLENGANSFEPPIALDSLSPKFRPLSKLTQSSAARSSSTTVQSYKDAYTQFGSSETSAETVVDWSTASSSYRFDPSLHESSPLRINSERSFLHERPLRPRTMEEKNKMKPKYHESINASTQTSPLPLPFTPRNSQDIAARDAIPRWPSLRKSPRLIDINAGVVSATASVLDLGYTDTNTLEMAREEVIVLPDQPENYKSFSSDKGKYIPLRLPLKVSQSTVDLTGSSFSHHVCSCSPYVQDTIVNALETFRVEMALGLETQRLWLEELVKVGKGSEQNLKEAGMKKKKLPEGEVARMEKKTE